MALALFFLRCEHVGAGYTLALAAARVRSANDIYLVPIWQLYSIPYSEYLAGGVKPTLFFDRTVRCDFFHDY
jgi:hypothetical protein